MAQNVPNSNPNQLPQAQDDAIRGLGTAGATHITEDTAPFSLGDLLANDQGGNAKRLYSLNDYTTGTPIVTANDLTATTRFGAQVTFNSTTAQYTYQHTTASIAYVNSLTVDSATPAQDEFTYTIRLGNGALSTARVTVDLFNANDAASIAGTATGSVAEDGTLTAGGTLRVSDADAGQNHFAPVAASALHGTYGDFTFTGGVWGYTLRNGDANVQALTTGQTVHDTLTVRSLDGSASQTIDVSIAGHDDAAVFGGTDTGGVREDAASTATPSQVASDTLTVSDADAGQTTFQVHDAQHALTGTYGSLTIDAQGHWTYTLNNSAGNVQALAEGQHVTDTIQVASFDGTTHNVTVVVVGTNDAPRVVASLPGDSAGTADPLTETNAGLTASGTLTVTDTDLTDSVTLALQGVATDGPTGSLTEADLRSFFSVTPGALAADPSDTHNVHWTFDSGAQAFNFLRQGETLTLSYTIRPDDAHTQTGTGDGVVTIRIAGTNDVAVIGDPSTDDHAVREESDLSAGGRLSITDADAGQAVFVPVAAPASGYNGAHGNFTLAADGTWSYALNNADSAVQALGSNDTLTDQIAVQSVDGTAHTITVNIAGTNDVAVISGTAAGSVSEDGTLTAGGTLSVSDADAGQNVFAAVDPNALYGTYGDFTFANGTWGYTLRNGDANVQSLTTGQTVHDRLTVSSLDGSDTHVIEVSVSGQNEIHSSTVLFIDDDGGINTDTTWISTLNNIGYNVTYESIGTNGNPISTLANYDIVIWSVGDRAYTNLTSQNVATLTSYLNQGGNLLYAGGHDLYEEPNAASSGFVQNYLGLSNYYYNMPGVDGEAHLHAAGPGGTYTLSDFSDNPGISSHYGGTMMSAFNASAPTASVLMEITSGGAHAGHSGNAYWDQANNDIAALNHGSNFNAATWGFDINQLDPQYRSAFLEQTLQLLV